ncbi:MAG: hypothetical protein PHF24_11120, partial [Syntrophomonas sp.]|nr:hypothetical protein [Syntrophomonas sp.]
MKKSIVILVLLMTVVLAFSLVSSARQSVGSGTDGPTMNPDGSRWRLGYCESEQFITYNTTLVAVVYGLQELGWIDHLEGFDQVANS